MITWTKIANIFYINIFSGISVSKISRTFPLTWVGKSIIWSKDFSSRASLKSHFNRFHIKARHYRCEICEKSFPTHSLLNEHIKTTHKSNRSRLNHQCGQCPEVFNNHPEYRHHLKNVHNTKNYDCNICNKIFHLEKDFEKHVMEVHTDTITKGE